MWKSFKAQLQIWNAYVAVLTTIIPDKLQTVAWIIKWRNAFLNIVILCQEIIVWYVMNVAEGIAEKHSVWKGAGHIAHVMSRMAYHRRNPSQMVGFV